MLVPMMSEEIALFLLIDSLYAGLSVCKLLGPSIHIACMEVSDSYPRNAIKGQTSIGQPIVIIVVLVNASELIK